MSADATHNPTPLTLTDSGARLAPTPPHFPTPPPQKLKSTERTRETLSRTDSTSIAESIAYPIFNREVQAKIPFKYVTKTPHKKCRICPKNPLLTPAKYKPDARESWWGWRFRRPHRLSAGRELAHPFSSMLPKPAPT